MNPQPSTTSVRWREILIFIILAYGLSWAWWLALIFSGAQTFSNLSQMNSDEAQAAQITIAIGNFGPLLAALVMRMFISREGLRGSIGWKRPFKFYLLAILTPILFFCILATFNHLTGLGRFAWTRADMPLGAYLGVELLIGAFIISIFILGEEYGWRGYLLPRALALGEVRGTILVGLVWAFWHLPLLLVGLNYPGVSPLLAIPLFTLVVIALSFPFTWLYKATSGSIVLASLFHGFINSYGDGLTTPEVVPAGNPLVTGSAGLVMLGLLFVLILFYYRLTKKEAVP